MSCHIDTRSVHLDSLLVLKGTFFISDSQLLLCWFSQIQHEEEDDQEGASNHSAASNATATAVDIAHNEAGTYTAGLGEAEAGFRQPRRSRSLKLENKGGGCLCRTSKGTNGLQRKCAISDFQPPTPLLTQRQGGNVSCWTFFTCKNYDRSRKCKVRRSTY